jgi:hypothetical protein
MLRDDSVSLREGDTYHGRYRILRCIEADSTGAAYEAVDVTTNARQILRVVSAGTTKGTGIHVQARNDLPIGENVAFLSEANFEQTAKSYYSPMDMDEDFESNAVTQICDVPLPEIGSLEPALPKPNVMLSPLASSDKNPRDNRAPLPMPPPEAIAVRRPIPLPPPPPLTRPDVTMRSSLPAIPLPVAPLPPPIEVLSLGVHASASPLPFGPLPPPAPPPERAARPVKPLPPPTITPEVDPEVAAETKIVRQPARQKIVIPKQLAVAAIVLVVGAVGYFLLSRDKPETPTNQSVPAMERTGFAPPPAEPHNAAPEATPTGADTKAPTNANPTETDRHEQEKTPPKTTPPKANKSPVDRGSSPTTKRRRETLY